MPKKSGSMDMETLIERLKADRSNLIGGGTPEQEIEDLSDQLKLALPKSYIQFLRAFDGGEFHFGRMHCITENGAGWFDFRLQLKDFFSMAPMMGVRNVLPFARSYGGDVYCFDLANVKNGEPAIVEYDHEGSDDQELIHRAEDLASWMSDPYKEFDKSEPYISIYIASESELNDYRSDLGAAELNRAGNDDPVVRCHFKVGPEFHHYSISFPDSIKGYRASSAPKPKDNANLPQLKLLAEMISRFGSRTESDIHIFVHSTDEMSDHARYKTVIGNLELAGKEIELVAGDHLRVAPSLKCQLIPCAPLENHVPRETALSEISCSFCGKGQSAVKKIIAGPGVQICDECVDLCNDILDAESEPVPPMDYDPYA